MTGAPSGPGGRDSQDVDALITDRYLDSILAAHGRGADTGPVPADVQPAFPIRLAADRLARDLPRLHPSFRFEETLAGKLSQAAARMRLPVATGGEPVSLPIPGLGAPSPVAAGRSDVLVRLRLDGPIEVGRPLLIGGAITSAAISLAGAAYVAWRIRHPQASPMVRAARAVARTRLT
ncbi:MAG: hypothetical protein WEE50_06660 [Chloroflexota bacterium]